VSTPKAKAKRLGILALEGLFLVGLALCGLLMLAL
jgi:hypothetical protein